MIYTRILRRTNTQQNKIYTRIVLQVCELTNTHTKGTYQLHIAKQYPTLARQILKTPFFLVTLRKRVENLLYTKEIVVKSCKRHTENDTFLPCFFLQPTHRCTLGENHLHVEEAGILLSDWLKSNGTGNFKLFNTLIKCTVHVGSNTSSDFLRSCSEPKRHTAG